MKLEDAPNDGHHLVICSLTQEMMPELQMAMYYTHQLSALPCMACCKNCSILRPTQAGVTRTLLQDAVQKWGTAEAEFSALQGAQVVEIATALKTFEDELVM